MNSRPFTLIAAIIFAVIALIHVYRLATDFQVILGSHTIGLHASWIAIVVAGALSFGLFREARR